MPSARRSETGLDMFRCSSLRWKTGLRAARATRGLTSAGRLKAIRKPMPTYAGTKNLNLRAPLELKTAEGHLWRGIDPRQRRPKKDDPTSYMDCRTYHIPGTLSGQAIYDEADTKVRTIARRICEENLGFKKVEEALRVATGNHVGARSEEHTSELQSQMR